MLNVPDRYGIEGTKTMALSDQLTNLAARAKELEDRAAAAKTKKKSDLEQDVKSTRVSAEGRKEKLSSWWDKAQRDWNDQMASIRREFDKGRNEHDLKKAQRAAESANEDAEFAIEFAYAALEEAEYAVLDAELAQMDADEIADDERAG